MILIFVLFVAHLDKVVSVASCNVGRTYQLPFTEDYIGTSLAPNCPASAGYCVTYSGSYQATVFDAVNNTGKTHFPSIHLLEPTTQYLNSNDIVFAPVKYMYCILKTSTHISSVYAATSFENRCISKMHSREHKIAVTTFILNQI